MAREDVQAPAQTNSTASRTLIVDPGAYTIKAGFASSDTEDISEPQNDCHVIPNCIARSRDKRVYIGAELEQCSDYGEMAFQRPVEKGYIVNWESERLIWEREFLHPDADLFCDPRETNLILTEPPNSPAAIQTNNDQIIFEEFEFAAAYRTNGPSLNAWNNTAALFSDSQPPHLPTEIMLVIDSGHSHTIITPVIHGTPLQAAIRRVSIGGKHLSNYLAELISLRHFSLIDEPHIVSQIKQDACFVSSDFRVDLERTWKGNQRRNGAGVVAAGDGRGSIVVDYVLPDYETLHRGFIRPHDASHAAKMARLGLSTSTPNDGANVGKGGKEEAFPLANERFVVPELLFSPTDIGVQESGIPETVMQSLEAMPRVLWQGLLGNVVLVGGCSLLPGFVERVESEIRMLAPAECVVRVKRAENPIEATWQGGARLASQHDVLNKLLVTREDYLEHGAAWTARQMATRRAVDVT